MVCRPGGVIKGCNCRGKSSLSIFAASANRGILRLAEGSGSTREEVNFDMNQPPSPRSSSNPSEETRTQQLSLIVHDLRHCLHVLRMGLILLKANRTNEEQFDEIHQTMEAEEQSAAKLLEELVLFARGEK